MFQCSLALTVMIVSYSLQVKHQPFLGAPSTGGPATLGGVPTATAALLRSGGGSSGVRGVSGRAVIGGPRGGGSVRRASMAVVGAAAGAVAEGRRAIMHLNVLEATMLRSSVAVLLCGMAFQSGQVLETGIWYSFLAAVVGIILVGSAGLFVGMVVVETRKICCLDKPPAVVDLTSTPAGVAGKLSSLSMRGLDDLSSWQTNPLRRNESAEGMPKPQMVPLRGLAAAPAEG